MTFRELKEKLQSKGAREIGRSKRTDFGKKPLTTIYFTCDKQVVFPFKLTTIGTIVLTSTADDQKVNSEQYKCLLRNLGLSK